MNFNLSKLTCSQLAALLETSPGVDEPKQLRDLRKTLCKPNDLVLLKLCGDGSAKFYKSYMKTALHVQALMQAKPIKLVIGGGMPKQIEMPPYTKAVRRMAEKNGIVAHRWGNGAFKLAKS